MKELFAYPVAHTLDMDGNWNEKEISVSDLRVSVFTEQVFIDEETSRVEASSKPVHTFTNELFSDLFGERPDIKGRKISIQTDQL